ncbi:MAG TPA: N-acetyl-alpha-D-glucosaminyl L-malate synthase BshA [Saprospiraceae bacterium]|nr:N-acetyl-alpha-D-glucosaminyl L-malate synthase BshA [Saprospiraceae bacterium]
MKIGVLCYPTFGGSGVVATELGMALANRGHQVHFISYKQPVRLNHFNQNIFFHEVIEPDYALFEQMPYESALVSTIVDVAQSVELDVLHVHYAIPHAAVGFMAREILQEKGMYLPVVTTLHGTDITLVGKRRAFAPIVEFSINKSDVVTAVSNDLRNQTYDYFEINHSIEVIYNFIDFNRFKAQDKSHFKQVIAPEGEKILIHTSNFRKVKRISDILDVFQKVREQIPVKLLLVGDGPERQLYERRCREFGFASDVFFLGKQQAVEELLSIADLFIMASEKESFGLAALEALACGVPLITTNAGGLKEVNKHGQTGFLSDVGDVDDMAHNALELLNHPDKLEQFRENALAYANEFSIDKIVPQYEEVYQMAIKRSVSAVQG